MLEHEGYGLDLVHQVKSILYDKTETRMGMMMVEKTVVGDQATILARVAASLLSSNTSEGVNYIWLQYGTAKRVQAPPDTYNFDFLINRLNLSE